MSKKILIIGGEGQVGLSLFSYLKKSYNVVNTSRKGFLKSVELDISNKQQVEVVLNDYSPDIIINCSSYRNVDMCELHRKDARDVMVLGLMNLIKESSKTCKIIQISSDYIFKGKIGKYSESDKADPLNYYGRLKLESENLLFSSNRDYAILRCSVIFSHFLDNKSNFLAWVYNGLKNKENMDIVDDQISNPTPVSLICKVMEAIILLNSKGVYNVGTLDSISRYDFAIKICESFSFNKSLIKKIKTSELKQVAKRPKNTYLNITKIQSELDIDVYSLDYYLKDIGKIIYE